MYKYLIRRTLYMVPTLLGAAILVFVLMRLIPGDIVTVRMATATGASQEAMDFERARLGLDKPFWLQFVNWIVAVAKGDLGMSMWTGRPVSYEIGLRMALSTQVAIMATLFATALAIPLGTWAALRQDTWVDYSVRIISIAGLATPSFWLGIMMLVAFLIVFHWTPPLTYVHFWKDPASNLAQLIWPALATGYRYSAVATRMTRSSVLEVLREDYVRTARAKGMVERLVVNRHALKNAMLPVITVIGLEFAFLVGGLVVTEQVFNLNGIGRLFVQAVSISDYTLVQGLVLLVVLVSILSNFVVDVFYAWLDPRIQYH